MLGPRRSPRGESPARDSNLDLIGYAADALGANGIACQIIHSADGHKANLFATIGPADKPGIMLSGHTDVVPVDGQNWTLPPFAMTRDANGNVVGFTFLGPELLPGATSAVLVVQTSLPTFTSSFASVINGTVVSPIFTFAPDSTGATEYYSLCEEVIDRA